MQPKVNTLAAHLAISLHPDLSGSDKRVASAIIEHFNRKTGRCDPSIGRLAKLLGLPDKTIRRATAKLHGLGLIVKASHGGRSGTAAYAPQWDRFIAFKAEWEAQRDGKGQPENRSNMAGATGQLCPEAPDKNDRQTHRRNPRKEPRDVQSIGTKGADSQRPTPKPPPQKTMMLPIQGGRSTSREVAATTAANQTVEGFLKAVRGRYDLYALNISGELHDQVVSAERRKKGAGVSMALRLLEELPDISPQARTG